MGAGINRKGISKDREAVHPGMVEENQESTFLRAGKKVLRRRGKFF